ncbi:MAG: iron-containing alcohol dehydrogenase [Treponema sp.]|nr:iron-containing alcohol dehydrogenase [Treponema sp.]
MADFIFKLSPNIVLGSYTSSRLGQFARDWGSKFMVVMDPILKEVGLTEKILQSLTDRNIEFFVFSELPDGASTKAIQQALALAKDAHIHGVIAVGGGKAMQIAKAVSAYYNEVLDLYTFVEGSMPSASPLPLLCLPTTPRAPFVFSDSIPVIDSRNKELKLLKVQQSLCKLIIFDPNLTVTLTENQITSMSLESLALLIEGYLSPKATFFSDMIIEKGVEQLGYALNNSQATATTTPMEVLLTQGGCMASLGTACSSVGTATLLSMTINSRFKISRSLVSSILIPYVIDDAANFKTERISKLAKLFQISVPSESTETLVSSFAENIRQRLAKANLPTRLKDLSVSIDKLSLAAEDAGNLELITTLPRSMTTDELFDLLKLAY